MAYVLVPLLVMATLFVAYANGANDNFKGVATLYGSNTTTFKVALWIGTFATLAGGVSSIFLAKTLVQAFSGKGLVPDAVLASPSFLTAVAAACASTLMLATALGFPVSTTHGLVGALIGAGFVAAGSALNLSTLGSVFLMPLILSPLVAILLTIPLYKLAHQATSRLGIEKEVCVCLGPGQFVSSSGLAFDGATNSFSRLDPLTGVGVLVGTTDSCMKKYHGQFFSLPAQSIVDYTHFLSGAAVSFARGLNDTPKIVALLLAAKALDIQVGVVATTLTMAIGGLLNIRKVAETMSKKISTMNDGQALTANLVTAFLVIFASRLGMPVSTTHVSVGAITGAGIVNRSVDKEVIVAIILSWIMTLPIAALIAGVTFLFLRSFG